jgi:hypothetical protein
MRLFKDLPALRLAEPLRHQGGHSRK